MNIFYSLTTKSLSFFNEIKKLEELHFTSEFQKNIPVPTNYSGEQEFVPIVKEYNIHSQYDGECIRARFYKPTEVPSPLIIYAHGGGWVYGNLDSHDSLCRRLALRTASTVLAVDYRLAPKYKFPIAINDFQSAYSWVLSNKIELGVLNDTVILAGDSAGGNIAAAVTCRIIKEKMRLPAKLILISPVLNLSFTSEILDESETCYLLTKNILNNYRAQYIESHHDTTHWMLSPLFFDELKKFPKTIIVTSDCDFLCGESELFRKKIVENGAIAECYSFPGVMHGFINCHARIPEAEEALIIIKNFLGNGKI